METGRRTPPLPYGRACRALGHSLKQVVPGVTCDPSEWVLDLQDNLLPGTSRTEIAVEFGSAAGKELDGKMKAPWSSSALAVNSFAPWRQSLDMLSISGIAGFSKMTFEAKCPNGISTIPPHIDVLLERSKEVVAIESKCVEYLRPKVKLAVSNKYLQLRDRKDLRSASVWFSALASVDNFQHLNTYQLIKHFLGLAHTYKDQPLTLIYIFWEPTNPDADPVFGVHRSELRRFADLVAGDKTCRFRYLSYLEHWRELEAIRTPPSWFSGHIDRLRKRYTVAI